jgi:hypothetical protein
VTIAELLAKIDTALDADAHRAAIEVAMAESRKQHQQENEVRGRVGDTEFFDLSQDQVDELRATCDGRECFFHPGCRPGECAAD